MRLIGALSLTEATWLRLVVVLDLDRGRVGAEVKHNGA